MGSCLGKHRQGGLELLGLFAAQGASSLLFAPPVLPTRMASCPGDLL